MSNALGIIDTVIMNKNAQYEIFQILGQTKQQKLKNKIRSSDEIMEMYIDQLLLQIKTTSLA